MMGSGVVGWATMVVGGLDPAETGRVGKMGLDPSSGDRSTETGENVEVGVG